MHSLISLGSFLYGTPGYQTERALVYPDNGAKTTIHVLMGSFIFILLGLLTPLLFLLTKKEEFLALAYILYGIALLLNLAFFFRILLHYMFLRNLEATGVPFNPDIHLSFLNYLRVIVFLPPEGYSTSQTFVQNEDEAIEQGKQS
ncbi:hypothetical protein TNCT_435301 [Trichonephila clavata]|uniref:Uncharacterized protein n=1 Tax=Trichonephila clavata TaxID=2740835 RepID=A0A8X6FXP9_TRICU|nr:hypothetical protein TNCT_435301 [Trichonephila clavata]